MDPLLDRVVAAVGDHYLIEGEVGRGGMAVVYRALDLRLNRHVAIKVLPPELAFNADVRTRFLREAQTAAQLGHPNVVPIFTVDERDGIVFFVMALIDGASLAELLSHDPMQPIAEVRRVLSEVADALAYAHGQGVVHRDIKPDNIIIERKTGRAVVTDFGIARAAAGEHRLTVTGVAVGTPAYMSPEQALGERDIDGRSDLYSLGVVGYQMLTGTPPFKAANTPAMLVKHVSEIPRPVRELRADVPPPLAAAIDRALAKKPDDRWSSAAAFRQAVLSEAIVAEPPQAAERRSLASALPSLASGAPAASPAQSLIDQIERASRLPPLPRIPPPPAGATREEWRNWKREQKYQWARWKIEQHGAKHAARQAARQARYAGYDFDEQPLEQRVMSFRRSVITTLVASPVILMINAATGGFPWFFFPVGAMVLAVLKKASSLWADGIGPIDAFKKGIRARLRAERNAELPAALPAAPVDPAAALVPADVLAGPFGDVVRRAAADRGFVREVVSKLGKVEKELLPDVQPTVDALVERIAGLAVTLHRLDADVSGTSLGQLDERIAALQRETRGTEGERRLALLQRQRSSLHDLLDRRRALSGQLESASLALQNLKLDLLKLRSAGVDAALGDVTSATQEARALSRDIANVLAAADDVRRL